MAIQIGAAVVGILGGLLRLSEQPLIAFLLVIAVLFMDSTASSYLGFQGAVGAFVSWVLSLLGVHILVTSGQILILVIIFPIVMFALQKSRQPQNG